MLKTASITDLRERLAEFIDALEEEDAILVVRHSKPAAYLVSRELFENLIERLEDLEDQADMAAALMDYRQGKMQDAEEAFGRQSL